MFGKEQLFAAAFQSASGKVKKAAATFYCSFDIAMLCILIIFLYKLLGLVDGHL